MTQHASAGTSPWRSTVVQALVALAAALLALGLVWRELEARHQGLLRESFELQTRRLTGKLQERMRAYNQVLRGAAGFVDASDAISRAEWRRYVARLDLHDDYRGIQGVGFSLLIPAAGLGAHEAEIRREGFPDYAVRPPGERPLYTSIIYLEPFRDRNLRAFGYDMFSEPVRRAAMERARDTGEIAYSGKVTLVQETTADVQAGILVYHPVYRGGDVPATAEERRAKLVGWAYSPFRMNDLMEAMLRADLEAVRIEVFDGEGTGAEALLFDSHPGAPGGGTLGMLTQVVLEGRTWTLRYSALPGFAAATRLDPPWVALLAVGSLALLVAIVVGAFVNSRRQQALVADLADSLRDSEEALQRAQAVARVGSWRLDLATGKLSWSRETYRLFGLPPDSPVDRETVVAHLHPDERAEVAARLEATTRGEALAMEHRLVVGDAVRWVNVNAEPLADARGRWVAVIGTVQDVTERRAMLDELRGHREHLEGLVAERTRELEAARDAAEAASRAKSNLLANLSHEFRTPMNAIVGLTSLIRRDTTDAEQLDRIRRVARAAESLLGMVDDLLELTRMDSATVTLRLGSLAVDDLLTRGLGRVAEAAADKGLTLASASDPQLHLLYEGDAARLGRMLGILLSNAVKFTEAGRVDVEVSLVERQPDGDLVRFAVRDTGIGIAPEVQARLFMPFEQADSSMTRRHGGAGLGLAVLRRLAEAMGARIGLESRPGEGSRFWFDLLLPRTQIPEPAPAAGDPPADSPGVPPESPAPGGDAGQPPPPAGVPTQEEALSALRAHPGLDVATGLRAVRDRPASYLRLIRKLAESHRHDVATVRDLLAAGRQEDARRTAHSLKGASGTLGALAIQDLARELEFAVRDALPEAELERIGARLDAAMAGLAEVCAAIPDSAPAAAADPAALAAATARLLDLLAQDDVAAAEAFRTSASLLREAHGEAAAELERLIAQFDFPAAHALLARLAKGAGGGS